MNTPPIMTGFIFWIGILECRYILDLCGVFVVVNVVVKSYFLNVYGRPLHNKRDPEKLSRPPINICIMVGNTGFEPVTSSV